jgi:hypothetical protein
MWLLASLKAAWWLLSGLKAKYIFVFQSFSFMSKVGFGTSETRGFGIFERIQYCTHHFWQKSQHDLDQHTMSMSSHERGLEQRSLCFAAHANSVLFSSIVIDLSFVRMGLMSSRI